MRAGSLVCVGQCTEQYIIVWLIPAQERLHIRQHLLEVTPEVGEPISIAHFKGRIREILDSYLALYPELNTFFAAEPKTLCDESYDIFLKTGCIYHTAYRITSAAPGMARKDGVQLERGMPLERQQYISDAQRCKTTYRRKKDH